MHGLEMRQRLCISRLCAQYLFSRCKILCILKCIVSRSIVSRYKNLHSLKINSICTSRLYIYIYIEIHNLKTQQYSSRNAQYFASRQLILYSQDAYTMHLEMHQYTYYDSRDHALNTYSRYEKCYVFRDTYTRDAYSRDAKFSLVQSRTCILFCISRIIIYVCRRIITKLVRIKQY